MVNRLTNSWKQRKGVLLAAAILSLVCAPQVQAECGGHSNGYPEPTVAVRGETEAPKNPTSSSIGWGSQVLHRLQAFWNSLSAPLSAFPCGSCPQAPTAPGNRCEGPFCKGDAVPTALPMAGTPEKSNELGFFTGLRDIPRYDPSSSFVNADCFFGLSTCLDTIFHPPRFS
jgi:hypothetical protein